MMTAFVIVCILAGTVLLILWDESNNRPRF